MKKLGITLKYIQIQERFDVLYYRYMSVFYILTSIHNGVGFISIHAIVA